MQYQQVVRQDQNQQQKNHYGKMIVLCSSSDQPSCMLGPQYYILIPAFLLIATLFILMYIKMYPILLFHWKILLAVAITLFLIAYIMVGLSNPGIVIKRLQQGYPTVYNDHQNDSYFCHVCGVLREKGTRHCEFCDICIKGHDHHCPWIGKCVGAQNKGSFYLFIIMTFATFLIFFIATLSSSK